MFWAKYSEGFSLSFTYKKKKGVADSLDIQGQADLLSFPSRS